MFRQICIMYCIISTVPVAFYWARSDDTVHWRNENFYPKFEIPVGCFLFEYEFWQRFRHVFCAKNCFRNAKFSEFGGYWGRGENFLTKFPKGTSLSDFTSFEPSIVQIRSRVFCSRRLQEKGTHTKSHREVIFHVFAGNSPTNQIQPKLAY